MPHIFVDAHVHIHPCFRPEALLASAFRNFQVLAQEINAVRFAGFLLLTESAGTDVFSDLRAHCATDRTAPVADFQIKRTGEAESLIVRDRSGTELYLVAGRQIVTAERLEVLALGCGSSFPDGCPIDQLLDRLTSAYAPAGSSASAASCRPLIVLPWGAGKWLGTRGRKMEQLVAQAAWPLFLGDNGNRPFFWPLPALFKTAQGRGIRNLAGSDPLPLPGQERKAGGFGVRLSGAIDPMQPFTSLCALLQDPEVPLCPFGRSERLYPFVRQQMRMRFGGKSTASAAPSA